MAFFGVDNNTASVVVPEGEIERRKFAALGGFA
jgi:hypothetical protein